MDELHQPKSEAMRALFWRDEILQLMYWIRGEGFGDQVDPTLLQRFLGVESAVGVRYLDRLVEEGLLDQLGGLYELTESGRVHGARVFAEDFADMTKPGHGECGADCWCHSSPDEAEACVERRFADHSHDH